MLRRCLEKVCRKHVAEVMGKLPDDNVLEEESKDQNSDNKKKDAIDPSEKLSQTKKEILSEDPNIIQLSNDPKIEIKEKIINQEQKFEIQASNKCSQNT
jgi:hypothetical protein